MDKSVAVVGVMPQGLGFPQSAEVWAPREMFPPEVSRSAHNWSVIGRLHPIEVSHPGRSVFFIARWSAV
jgi:hypothetical protein